MEKAILYSNDCPKCRILKKKLDEAQIDYETVSDVEVMLQKGFTTTPMLQVSNNVMSFAEAVNFINKR